MAKSRMSPAAIEMIRVIVGRTRRRRPLRLRQAGSTPSALMVMAMLVTEEVSDHRVQIFQKFGINLQKAECLGADTGQIVRTHQP